MSSARDADEREKWIHALEGTILRHTLQLQVCNQALVANVGVSVCIRLILLLQKKENTLGFVTAEE